MHARVRHQVTQLQIKHFLILGQPLLLMTSRIVNIPLRILVINFRYCRPRIIALHNKSVTPFIDEPKLLRSQFLLTLFND